MTKAEKRYQTLIDVHCKELHRIYGRKRANRANVGWGQSDDSISSKVYGSPCMILTSSRRGKKIVHEETEY